MTPEQLTTLGAYIATVPAWAALPNNSDTAYAIAAELNQPASPAWTVWRTELTRKEAQGSGFDWTQVDNLTVGQARIWFDGLFEGGVLNASEEGQRAGIVECWKGTAAKVAVQVFMLGKCKRSAKLGEKVLSTGTGSVAAPAVMTHEGDISYPDVQAARAL
ncbi:MAG: hypothetical protein IPG77_25250 [Betaproteobacteria bacterium]|nr:hypothetical protein [Betaproteobacteria bacterium]